MWNLIFTLLCIVLILIFVFHREHNALALLKQRYWATLDMLRKTGDPAWNGVLRPSIITGMRDWTKARGPIGSNVNKGYEIYICLDGNDVNSAMYVLIHELAHMSVPEYDHTSKFWENFKKLKDLCVGAGLYTPSGERGYCGDTIRD
jgi:hypothetical protein